MSNYVARSHILVADAIVRFLLGQGGKVLEAHGWLNRGVFCRARETATELEAIAAGVFEKQAVVGGRILWAELGTFDIAGAGCRDDLGDAIYFVFGLGPERQACRVRHMRWILNQSDKLRFRMVADGFVGNSDGRRVEGRKADGR